MKYTKIYLFALTCLLILSCQPEKELALRSDTANMPLLEQLDESRTNLDFVNQINENETFNTFTYDGFLQGTGVGVLDVNNDGLQDIYFASSEGKDRLYLNKGNLKFEDITESAGITSGVYYSSGISVVDINDDGYDDIYVNRFLYNEEDKLRNKLFVNQKNGTFVESAASYGIDDPGYSTCATFFDMDGDNDLDLYVGNQPPNDIFNKQKLKNKIAYRFSDNLYRNDGGKFINVTDQAGVTNYNYTLSVNPVDYDQDGDIDLHIASDYAEPDYLYTNDGKGTFVNRANEAFRHISNFAMGTDVADVNNDGMLDIFTVDMVAEDNFRQKTNMSGMNPERFWKLANAGYHHQYMFNSLQLNNGNGMFSEIAQMSGISNTDWSWAPLFMDLDQDGFQDLFVTNGVFKEVRNKDYEIWRTQYFEDRKKEQVEKNLATTPFDPMVITERAPSVKLPNYFYKNNGDMTFINVSEAWNFNEPSWSSGAAYADFDNDGDLDIVINNSNMPCFFYQNMANEKALNNYAMLEFKGPAGNQKGYGAQVKLFYGENSQAIQLNPYRGYMSSNQSVIHVGLGSSNTITKLEVVWPDKKMATYENLAANKTHKINYSDAQDSYSKKGGATLLTAYNAGIEVKHAENAFDDYEREVLLPHKMSTLGPIVTVADVNQDGNDDFYVGGSMGESGEIYLGTSTGKFTMSSQAAFEQDKGYEDGAAVFFDADGDQDMDLYVASGGNEFERGNAMYQDRLYINNKGTFEKTGLATMTESNGAVAAGDYDGDGDIDLFVGGRQVPGKYGYTPKSFFLKNDKGRFGIDQELEIGMISDAHFTNVDQDSDMELVTSGEWNPIQLWERVEGQWTEATENAQLEKTNGWWNKMKIEDMDGDGDMDILAGNLGLNLKFKASEENPFRLYVDDFDQNGSNDVYLGYHAKDGKYYPVRGRQCSSEQMPFVKKEFKTYNEFGLATIEDVLKDKVDGNTVKSEVFTFQSTYFENNGEGKFNAHPFSTKAQIAPIQGFAVVDLNKDGKKDFVAAGNYYNREVETTRSDAGTGVVAMSQGENQWDYKNMQESGFNAFQDVREVHTLKSGNETVIAVFNNNSAAEFYRLN